MMKVRLARLKDKEDVLRILKELGEEINKKEGYSPHNIEVEDVGGPTFEEIIRDNRKRIFVATKKNKIVGLATFYLLPTIRHGCDRGHIEDFVVTRKERGRGVGSKLLRAIKEYCRENGIKVIKLGTGITFLEAQQFYEKQGGISREKLYRFDLN